MKFYYENSDFHNVANGTGFCGVSNLDWQYGLKNHTTELTNEPTIWNFSIMGEMQGYIIENNIEYFKSVFQQVKRKPNVKLVFSNFHEGANQNDFIIKLVQLKNQFGLNKNQIYVVTNNKYSEIYNKHIEIMYKPYLLGFLVDHYRDIKDTPLIHKDTEISLCSTQDYLSGNKSKFFLSYNKNTTRPFRIQLILWLMKTGLIDDTYVSILIKDENFDRNHLRSTEDELYDLIAWFNQFEKKGFNVLDWDYPNHQNDVFSNLRYTTKSHYTDTLFNIITETSCKHNSLNLTEKSFKAIANCSPYFVIGDMGTNQHIKSLGFELYEDLIDYSFDSIEDDGKRLNEALKQIRRIYNMGSDGIIDWYKKNVDKLEQNKSRFFEYSFSEMMESTIFNLKDSYK